LIGQTTEGKATVAGCLTAGNRQGEPKASGGRPAGNIATGIRTCIDTPEILIVQIGSVPGAFGCVQGKQEVTRPFLKEGRILV
jgi:hypothetical protein